jgi:MtrB/PioB family decaheme-associated outer membrane protein
MRNRLMSATAALLLASASSALAQQKAAEPVAAPTLGTVTIGFQGSNASGDKARFERYQDLRNRQSVQIDLNKETEKYLFDLTARNLGNRDGFYGMGFQNGKLKMEVSFGSTPLNYGYNTRTPWAVATNGAEAVLTLDQATRLAIENKTLPSNLTGIPTTAAQAALPSVWREQANPFDLQSRRDTLHVGLTYAFTKDVEAELVVASHKRTGSMPIGAGFAFNNAAEIPVPLDDRTTEVEAGVAWATQQGMLRVGYERSMFSNTYNSVMWDNPIRATDWNGTKGTGWDPSGYSNGNGPARGRLATSPDNSLDTILATGLIKFAKRTSLSGNLALLSFKQDDTLIPWTTNPVIANSTVYASYPYLARLPRNTAEGKVKGVNASFVFNTRMHDKVNFTARYRYNKHDNQTTPFVLENTVRFDAVPEPFAGESEPYTITQNKFDADASFSVLPFASLKVGYGFDGGSKTYLVYRKLTDNTVRASFDTVGNQYVTLRALVEHTKRSGSQFHQEAITDPGGQPNSRLFDDAERNRDRATLLVTLTPTAFFDVTASYAMGKDDYEIGLNPQFGLLNNENKVVNVGFNVNPTDLVSFGINYGREKYSALQKSRNANPNSGVPGAYESWVDPNREWSLDTDETVNNFDVYLHLNRALPRTDIGFNYTLSDSDNAFVHSGPRIDAMKGNLILTPGDGKPCAAGVASCFEALPNVTNKWQRATFDVKYALTPKVGIGASVWYEKFDVSDFATIDLSNQAGQPRIDYLGEINTGYGNRPYKGTTGFLGVFYHF